MKKYLPLIITLMVLAALMFVNSCANTTLAPSGGKKDTIPPVITMINPLPGAKDFPVTGGRIFITFSEYVTIKDAKNIFLSPPCKKAPTGRVKGMGIEVSFPDTLLPNTTYTLSLNSCIADNNEGNMFPGYNYVFSTGSDIDSMIVTGAVRDCGKLEPVKNATVLLYKDQSDSAIFLSRPDAASKTDDWGYFTIPFIKDTIYRMYALEDKNGNNMFDPLEDRVAFLDSTIRPVMTVSDTLKEFLRYDMKDTLGCRARKEEYELLLFKEKSSVQSIKNYGKNDDRDAFVSFTASDTWIDSLWIGGYPSDKIITQFNLMQDSLNIWINDRNPIPDTLSLHINYRKTDSLGNLVPSFESFKLYQKNKKRYRSIYEERKDRKHEDSICVFKLEASAERVDQDGYSLTFAKPIINGRFDRISLKRINARQQESFERFSVERDSLDYTRYVIRPDKALENGSDYILKIPQDCFRDIDGWYNDSTELKLALPVDDKLCKLILNVKGVDSKYIIDLLDEKQSGVIRSVIINSDKLLEFPYLKSGKYCIRVTDDGNQNQMVDTGNLLRHLQPEKVRFFKLSDGQTLLDLPEGTDLMQDVDIRLIMK